MTIDDLAAHFKRIRQDAEQRAYDASLAQGLLEAFARVQDENEKLKEQLEEPEEEDA